MIVGAASGWSQSTLNQPTASRNPLYRTLFNMADSRPDGGSGGAGTTRLGGTPIRCSISVAAGAAVRAWRSRTFFVNTAPIAVAIGADDQPERVAHLDERLRVERAELRCSARRPPRSSSP